MISPVSPALLLTALLLVASCAVSPEVEQRRKDSEAQIESILSEPLDAEQFGASRRCLSDHEFRSFRALDDRHILFEGRRDRLWINTLRMRCPDLRHASVLRVKSISTMSNRLCDKDSFQAGDWFDWPWYRRWPWHWQSGWGTKAICHLGVFQPVTEGQVAAIERAIRSR